MQQLICKGQGILFKFLMKILVQNSEIIIYIYNSLSPWIVIKQTTNLNTQSTNYQVEETMVFLFLSIGSAYIVQSNVSGKLFVAKKMQLDGLTEKEI